MIFKEDLSKELGIQLSKKQESQFEMYYDELIEYNKHTNLTRITDEIEVFYKHFFDSLTIVKVIDISEQVALCDMGAGAGFPSIPIKIVYPHLHVTIIDSSNKRINFLKSLLDKLGINQIELICDRVENYAIKNQLKFDLVTARALGALPLILELGVPMLKNTGHFIAFKSGNFKEELDFSKNALSKLHSKIYKVVEFSLPNQFGDRALIDIVKNKHISGYPRPYPQMLKKPL
jgi:16S rRNA (guanine527-N7)-methyltransferase